MIEIIAQWIINIIYSLGYPGIILTMAIESALIPLPSEIIMPFSGYLVSTGVFNIHLVAISGAIGNVLGSLAAYGLGYYGKDKVVHRFVRNYGKWILLSEEELVSAEKLLNKYKDMVVLVSRIVPGVRTVISLPAGIAKLPLRRFIVLTFLGSLVWSYFLAYIGLVLGQNWKTIGPYFHKVDGVIVILAIALVAWYIWHKLKH